MRGYSKEQKLKLLRLVENARNAKHKAQIIQQFGVTRATYHNWMKQAESGELENKKPGRHPLDMRKVLREEIARAFEKDLVIALESALTAALEVAIQRAFADVVDLVDNQRRYFPPNFDNVRLRKHRG